MTDEINNSIDITPESSKSLTISKNADGNVVMNISGEVSLDEAVGMLKLSLYDIENRHFPVQYRNSEEIDAGLAALSCSVSEMTDRLDAVLKVFRT